MNVTLTLPGVVGVLMPIIYFFTRTGAPEHEGWFFTKQTLLVAVLSTLLICIGFDGQGIWYLLTTVGH